MGEQFASCRTALSRGISRVAKSALFQGFIAGFLIVLLSWQALAEDSKILQLDDGVVAGQARIDLIQSANRSITAQYFIYADDETSYVALALFREAARRGVRVRIIVDAFYNGIPKGLREYLTLEGVEIMEYHPINLFKPGTLIRRMHDKVLIVDERQMIAGGRNIQNDYFTLPGKYQYDDRDLYVEGGEAVASAARYFEELWQSPQVRKLQVGMYNQAFISGDCTQMKLLQRDIDHCERRQQRIRKEYKEQLRLLDSALLYLNGPSPFVAKSQIALSDQAKSVPQVRFVHDPVGKKDEWVGTGPAILELFDSAKHEIVIESPYASPHDLAYEALQRARDRGVRIVLLTNSPTSGDNGPALVGYYKEDKKKFLEMGVELFEYRGPHSIHAKTYVVDGRRAYVGSYNLDRLSHKYNTETGVLFEDEEVAQSILADIEEAQQNSFIIGSDGKPTNLRPGEKYPWRKGKKGLRIRILEVLLPFYRHLI